MDAFETSAVEDNEIKPEGASQFRFKVLNLGLDIVTLVGHFRFKRYLD